MRSHWQWRLVLVVAALVAACKDDGTDAETMAEPAGGAITLWTDSTELFMEHPALIVGAPDKFAVHLTDLTDFAPLRSGRIVLRFQSRAGGTPVIVSQDTPRAPGIYGPSPEFTAPGTYDLTILVESPQARDSIEVRDLRVYASAAEAPGEEAAGDGGIGFLKEQQWKTPGFATAFAARGALDASVTASGQIVPAGGRMARVTAPISGLVEPGGVAQSPAPGQRVTRGQTLALLTPALGEGGSAFAQARAELREAQDDYDRARRLFEVEAVPERRLHEAEIRLTAAKEALAGFGSSREDGRVVIRAAIGGVIGSRTLTPGSRVEGGDELFTIVDPSVVWLQVDVPAAEAGRIGRTRGATFRVAGSDSVFVSRRAISVGSIIDSVSRTVPVIYEIQNSGGALKIGMTAQVSVMTGQPLDGIVIPSAAVLDEDGRPIAYVQPEGERFEKRGLVIGGSDGIRTLVLSGINAGERVVTGAAYQVRLASLSTAVPAHGHEH